MKKHNVESPQESLPRISEIRLVTLKPKGTKSDYDGSCHIIVNGHTIFGLQVASKVFEIICDVKLGKPYALQETGRNSAKSNNGAEGRGESKKQMTVCNELYRGSKFALIRKDADLLNGVLLHEWRYCL
ncbi:putative uncharacterized protein [groundwater metagenome]